MDNNVFDNPKATDMARKDHKTKKTVIGRYTKTAREWYNRHCPFSAENKK